MNIQFLLSGFLVIGVGFFWLYLKKINPEEKYTKIVLILFFIGICNIIASFIL
jgi:hypothetical protein